MFKEEAVQNISLGLKYDLIRSFNLEWNMIINLKVAYLVVEVLSFILTIIMLPT